MSLSRALPPDTLGGRESAALIAGVPTMGIRFLTLLAFVALPSLAGTSEVWQSKPVEEWTRQETQEFFRDSPWVHQVIVTEPRVMAQPASFPPSTREPERNSSSAEGTKTEPRFGANGVPVETAYYIEWSSAKVVRRAGAHYRALQGKGREDREPPALDGYFLTVSGYDLTAFDAFNESELQEAAYLRLRERRENVQPVKVEKLWNSEGKIIAVRYSFPRQKKDETLITDRDHSVNFVCKAGELRLKTRFELAEMVIGKGRDL
jgi:hypothetical protein